MIIIYQRIKLYRNIKPLLYLKIKRYGYLTFQNMNDIIEQQILI